MKPHMGTITKWAIVMHAPFGYVVVGLRGEIGDSYVRTSPIVKLEKVEGGFEIETTYSLYRLRGEPNDAEGRAAYRIRTGRDI
jgi:hypothetical protein